MGEVSLNNFGNLVPAFNASAIVNTANDSSNPMDREVSSWNKAQQITSREASTKLQMFKTHNAAATVNGVEFPNKKLTSKAVYIVRDPRDVAVSYARHCDFDINASIEALLDDRFCLGKKKSFLFWFYATKTYCPRHISIFRGF